MRKTAKALGLVVVSFMAAVVLAVGSAFTAAIAFGATALIVPGTGTPIASAVQDYMKNARDRYITPFNPTCDSTCATKGIDYPASFFPLVIFPGWCRSGPDGCDKWNDSVGKGTTGLTDALAPYLKLDSKEDVTIFGYSQGGAVVSNVLQNLGGLDQSVKDRLHVVTIGGIENPDGGLWSRLGFLPTIPFLDITFGPPMKTDTGIPVTAIGFQYDPVTYAPLYFGNPLAVLNAIAALETVHGNYLVPDGTPLTGELPYGYTPETLADQLDCTAHKSNCRVSGTNTYIMIPATTLPLFDLITGSLPAALKPFVKPIVDLLTPVTKVLVDLGYDFSGDPNVPRPLSILPFNPFQNWLKVGLDLAGAVGQGIQAAAGDLGPSTTLAPATTPVTTTSTSAGSTPQTTLRQNKLALVPETSPGPVVGESTGNAPLASGDPAVLDTNVDVPPTVPTAGGSSATPPTELPKVEDEQPLAGQTGDLKVGGLTTDDLKSGGGQTGGPAAGDLKVGDVKTGDLNTGDPKTGGLNTADLKNDVSKQADPKNDAPKSDAPKSDAGDASKKDAA